MPSIILYTRKCQFFLQHKDREWSFATIVFKGSRKNVSNLFSIVNSKHLFLCCYEWSNSSKFMSMLSNFPQILLLCYELKLLAQPPLNWKNMVCSLGCIRASKASLKKFLPLQREKDLKRRLGGKRDKEESNKAWSP